MDEKTAKELSNRYKCPRVGVPRVGRLLYRIRFFFLHCVGFSKLTHILARVGGKK